MTIAPEQITGLILAGGRGRRMGGVDKGLQTLHGQPMVAHVMARLQPQVTQLAINANRNSADYAAFGLPVWPDLLPGFAGPLAGLHSGLTHCRNAYLLSAPCDSPFLPADLSRRLAAALVPTADNAQAKAAIAVTGQGAQRQRHPVFCLLSSDLLGSLSAYLAQDGRRMDDWFASLPAIEVVFEDEQAFSNINTVDQLQQLETSPALPSGQ